MALTILCVSFTLLLLLGVPVAFFIGISSLLTLLYEGLPLAVGFQQMISGMSPFSFLAIPFFIFAGEIMMYGGIADRIVDFAKSMAGHVRGGLGMSNVLACTLFGGVSGSPVADVSAMGSVLIPQIDRNETGISDLSVRLAMPKATVYRFLQTMMTLGYVRQEADSERYGLTMKVFELGTKALQYPELVDLAKNHMQMLADKTGETVHLGTLIDSEIIYVHKVDSRHMLGMYSKVGRRAPLHCTAIGKVLMAWEHPERRALILQGAEFKRFRDKTIVEPEAFAQELERVKAQGFGEDREEFDDHIRCVGVPIFDRLNRPIAGMSISFPTFRYDPSKEGEVVAMLTEASRDISSRLGCTHFPLDAA